jgi:hypothetical protein
LFVLGERAAADASGLQPLLLADTVSDLTEETLDAALSLGPGHEGSVPGARETRVSCGWESAESPVSELRSLAA